ncbi:hypothetical protein H7Q97_15515 [Ochrobactrum sp. CM-21-5]|nr:hypothetical protein [Ochrobactrum sp. CM-21-5]MBC2886795.1 hypothetical protein [Ochrobactrum sp. CM-21-5]
MKTVLIATGIFLASTIGGFAAEPAKMMDSESGKILVTAKGMTLYSFDKDQDGKSACDAKCLKMWPAFQAGNQAKAVGDFTIVKSTNGDNMWAYKGMPLYLYHDDRKAGEVKGDGKGGVWHVVK